MRKLSDVIAASPKVPAFSNGTDGYDWMSRWCDRCRHPVEIAWQNYNIGKRKTQMKGYEGGCPLLMAAMTGDVTPTEWLPQDEGPDRYHCIEFRGPDDGRQPPRPKPEPPGMEGLFERPQRGIRTLKQPASQPWPTFMMTARFSDR
ncbi:hypothetical protein BTO20_37545 (plasmid) [Mycobacterium dioxanotrophicus]|jgi:hypothetical protein|uniref:Uncharacterized protein n=1 Tax=Mycobacterium dioxanotrophicus TaxID=482462 RepID=A0A1Y0CGF0_9MYCO|nr:hypothetical protein [Mycobacterium dioxanotrophicus]ART74330.1 hypothetical protein BTO20_37545 [Mycobacterium dioxanotrophicus]